MKSKIPIIITCFICIGLGYLIGSVHTRIKLFGKQVHLNLQINTTIENCTGTLIAISEQTNNPNLIENIKKLNGDFENHISYDTSAQNMKKYLEEYNQKLSEVEIKKQD